MSALDLLTQPVGLTLLDADDADPGAIEANTWREWAADNATGQRMRFDWMLTSDPSEGWMVDTNDARYVAARKKAILRRRGAR